MLEDAKLMINLLLILANYQQGGGIPQRTPKGKRMFELAKMLWIFEWIIEVTIMSVELDE